MNLAEAFEGFNEDFLHFERIESKRSNRPDLHAFLLLDSILPGQDRDIISAAEHDQIWLDVNCEELNKVLTVGQIRELTQCGVMYDEDLDSLSMFT